MHSINMQLLSQFFHSPNQINIPTPTCIQSSLHMDQYNKQNQGTYLAPPTSYPPSAAADRNSYSGPYVMAPPPMGYPTKEGTQQHWDGPVETKSKGDGFLKGCLAGLCCCCCLDVCF